MTCAQYATMLAGILWTDEAKSFGEASKVQPWYMPYVLTCEGHGVFAGTIFDDCPDWDIYTRSPTE